ncbi:hypothetical protein BGZ73_003365 [Actinomortierella ambigua]|nr:hypothetical protein BGZ73_003365 [Actinomortierella ambigua]
MDSLKLKPKPQHMQGQDKPPKAIMSATEPKTEDYIHWATGRQPRHPPQIPAPPRAPSNTELVSMPFTQGVKPSGASGASLFRDPKNHPDAVGTILTHAATLANFFPAKGLEDQTDKFSQYITKVSSFPGFMLTFNEQTGQKQTHVDVDLMIDEIKQAYEGVIGADVNKVVTSIKSMANSIINKSSNKADRSLFTQMSIMSPQGDSALYVTIFYTTLHMEMNQQHKKTYSSQSYYINRSVFKVLTNSLISNADKLAELLGDGSFEDWAKGATSPGGPRESCFDRALTGASKEM